MEVTEVLKALERNRGFFPGKAVEAAMEMREELIPALLRILEDTLVRAGEIAAEDEEHVYFAHIYAMFLLARFRETRAYPLVVRFARLEEDLLDALAGDFVTQDLRRVLASVCGGDTGPIKQLVEDPAVYAYARSAALRSLLVLVATGEKPRDEVVAYIKSLFEGGLERSRSFIWDALVECASQLHPGEVYVHIVTAFEEGLVDPGFISLREVERRLNGDTCAVHENLCRSEGGLIENVAGDMSWWACFKEPKFPKRAAASATRGATETGKAETPQPRRTAKTGPNAPCPCGSGRKYKKCCGRVA